MHLVLSKFVRVVRMSKSLLLKDNPQMITKEVFEDNLADLILKRKLLDQQRSIQIERYSLKRAPGEDGFVAPNSQATFLAVEIGETLRINEHTKLIVRPAGGVNQNYIESSDYHIRYLLHPDSKHVLHLSPGTRIGFGAGSHAVVIENQSFQECYYHRAILNFPPSRKQLSPNKVIQASMIPKVKLLFISGPLKTQKFLFEPSMEIEPGKGK